MPFNLRNFEEEAKAKMGVVECVSHKLIEPFQVLYEKHGKWRHNVSLLAKLITGCYRSVNILSRHFATKIMKSLFGAWNGLEFPENFKHLSFEKTPTFTFFIPGLFKHVIPTSTHFNPFKNIFQIPAEFVAQFKHTVLLLPNGLIIVTGYPFDETLYESEHSIPDGELKEMVTSELKLVDGLAAPKEKKPKKPKKGKENSAAAAAPTPEKTATETKAWTFVL